MNAATGKMASLAVGLAVTGLFVGCVGETGDEEPLDTIQLEALSSVNGLTSVNGLIGANGLSSVNGLTSVNGLSSVNGLTSVNGLSSANGLMTTGNGRTTVAYVVRCALPAGRTLYKKDQYGNTHKFAGQFGLGAEWEFGSCGTSCQEAVSACIMAHINVSGIRVPLWFDSPNPKIGTGLSSTYPNQEGTFFGNLFVLGPDGKVPAYYCEGPGFAKGVVPGRIGGPLQNPFRNPFGAGVLCSSKCVAMPYPATGDTYKSCYGYTNPITVWRGSSYRPDFNTGYSYRLINSQTKLALDIAGGSKSDGASVIQWPFTGSANQLFKIELVASSTWRLRSVSSGKAITGTGTASGSAVKQYTYRDTDNHEWGVDDHNGHFKLANKATKHVLQVPSGNYHHGTSTQTGVYYGSANQDWDIVAVP